ncbi:MAG: hypothetical protein AB8B97_16545 [Granulosicoccus sp.]
MRNHPDSGYVLLSLLVLLLGVGGGWMSLSANARLQSSSSSLLSLQERQGLVSARQALLSYATLYPYLYGPTGAGPGHLPCPDSDGFREFTSTPQSEKNQRRDGPNPPCASLNGTTGLLPRHTLLPGHRYLFHAESSQRYEYHVVGGMVNNPLNRIVNLQVLKSSAQETVATISLPSSNAKSRVGQVTITGQSLINSTVASVASWLLQRSKLALQASCAVVNDDSTDSSESFAGADCRSQSSTPYVQCEHEDTLVLVLDKPLVRSGDCLGDSLASNTLEGVPALRHWFVRNRWYQSMVLVIRDECRSGQLSALECELYLSTEQFKAVSQPGSLLELYWGAPL